MLLYVQQKINEDKQIIKIKKVTQILYSISKRKRFFKLTPCCFLHDEHAEIRLVFHRPPPSPPAPSVAIYDFVHLLIEKFNYEFIKYKLPWNILVRIRLKIYKKFPVWRIQKSRIRDTGSPTIRYTPTVSPVSCSEDDIRFRNQYAAFWSLVCTEKFHQKVKQNS